jgi:hypothetical protein
VRALAGKRSLVSPFFFVVFVVKYFVLFELSKIKLLSFHACLLLPDNVLITFRPQRLNFFSLVNLYLLDLVRIFDNQSITKKKKKFSLNFGSIYNKIKIV